MARAASESRSGASSPSSTNSEPSRERAPNRATEAEVVDLAFVRDARTAWDTEGPLTAEDEAHIDNARARVFGLTEAGLESAWESAERHLKEKGVEPAEVLERAAANIVRAPAEFMAVAARAIEFAKESRSKATRRAYKRQWQAFCGWCREHGVASLPAQPSVVALYITSHADHWSVATLRQALSSIGHYHKQANEPSPHTMLEVSTVWEGIKRTKGVAPKRRAQPLTPEQLRAMVLGLKPGLTGVRDRALLCLGLAGAFRRSEIVALNVEDLDFVEDGVAVLVRSSKTDQEGHGEAVGVAFGDDRTTCAVRALRDWLAVSGIEEGPIFRGIQGKCTENRLLDRDVARILKRAAARVGISVERLSGHSLRAGLATTAAKRGKSLHSIAKQGRWKSMQTVSIYIRDAELFEDNASSGIGL